MLKAFSKIGYDVELTFPNRAKNKISAESIYDFYNIREKISLNITKYYLPFDKINILNKFSYIVSHFLWSFWVVGKYFSKSNNSKNLFFTRSIWVLYFLAKKNYTVVFEAHKTSKTTFFIFKNLRNKNNVGFIFINKNLFNAFQLSDNQKLNSLVLSNGFEEEDFENLVYNPKKNTVVFMGRLTRYEKSRNVEFLINAFNQKLLENYELNIIGGPKEIADKFRLELHKNNIKNINIYDHLPQQDLFKFISNINIGVLLNSSETKDSILYTSPLKFFEYIRVGLKVIAVDFSSHRSLPYSNKIKFFSENDTKDFTNKLIELINSEKVIYNEIDIYEYSYRAKKIRSLFARLEGLEPPTL